MIMDGPRRIATMRSALSLLLLLASAGPAAAARPPIYLWLEPEWFEGVRGTFAYWTGTAKPTQAWRQVDAVLLTDDLAYTPVGREKPPFSYLATFGLRPTEGPSWRGSGRGLARPAPRTPLGGRDFSMWTGIDTNPKWWA